MAEFLFEIGLEEVPARMIAGAEAELRKRLLTMLERERLLPTGEPGAVSFSTPRRLAVLVSRVAERQADVSEQVMGPAVKVAYKDGVPGPAAEAFARKSGVAVDALTVVSTPKGDYVAATSVKPGRSAAEVIAEGLPKELAGIYWAKNMYWRAGRPERFVRPVRWIVALLGETVVPVEFGGSTAGRVTYGHRVLHGAAPISIAVTAAYASALRAAFVEPEVGARRHTIRKALDRVCRTIAGARWREDHALVDKMTHMTEWPSVIAGAFEPEYLQLPEEVLVTVMRDHQNYFAVEDSAGKLMPHFLAVLNTAADAAGEGVIRHGNERVLRARFNDARFFWEFDQRVPLEDRVALLENVTFQKDLGSYAAKSLRVAELARALGYTLKERGVELDAAALEDAARLFKTDLTTELVKEFTELQGEIGGLYGRTQGLSEAAAAAIYDHYRPTSMEDRIPRTVEGQVLALADKLDTIAGMFGLGMEPTGSKDPFALRRAANGIVRILAEGQVSLTLSEVVGDALEPALSAKMLAFFAERVEFYLREAKGQAYDVVKAVLAAGADDVRDAVARGEAVSAARGSEDFLAVCAAFKRMKNILSQAVGEVIPQLLDYDGTGRPLAESSLLLRAADLRDREYYLRENTAQSIKELAELRPLVDRFFAELMVMDSDLEVRRLRLWTLKTLVASFSGIADFSEIVVAG